MGKKFENLILYICQKSAGDHYFGRTKLNKLLYFADFGHFREHGHPISGEKYMALQNGPVPRHMIGTLDQMKRAGTLREDEVNVGANRPMLRPAAIQNPDISQFSSSEISYVDEVLAKYARMTGTELANLSHAEPGYRAARDKETIEYGTSYLPPYVTITPALVRRTNELAKRYGWNDDARC